MFLLGKYGTQTTFLFPMTKRGVVDFAQSGDWTPASADGAISKDGGALADCTNAVAIVTGSPTRGASLWKLTLTATEMQAATITVQIVDAATKAVEDQAFIIYTYGNASAQFKCDFSEASLGILNLVNTGATYNVQNSVGKQIRTSGGGAPTSIRSGTAQSGSTAATIKLDSGASATDNIYNGNIVVVDGGTGIGQTRTIVAYNGTTKVATVDSNWITTPDNTSTFTIYAAANSIISDEGTAQAGDSTTITLRSGAAAGTDFYKNSFVTIVAGTGSGQTRVITAYNGSTKVATVDSAWSVTPDNTSVYQVLPAGSQAPPTMPSVPSSAQNAAAVLASALSTAPTAGTVAEALAACRAQGIGKWTLTGTTLTIYAHDGVTALATLTLDSATVPTQRA